MQEGVFPGWQLSEQLCFHCLDILPNKPITAVVESCGGAWHCYRQTIWVSHHETSRKRRWQTDTSPPALILALERPQRHVSRSSQITRDSSCLCLYYPARRVLHPLGTTGIRQIKEEIHQGFQFFLFILTTILCVCSSLFSSFKSSSPQLQGIIEHSPRGSAVRLHPRKLLIQCCSVQKLSSKTEKIVSILLKKIHAFLFLYFKCLSASC